MKKGIVFFILIFCMTNVFSQQDPQYSQYMFNLAAVNPASAGSSGKICLSALHREQWVGFEGAPTTTFFQANAPFRLFGINTGAGLSICRDNIGFNTDLSINLNLAYRLALGNGELAIGPGLGFVNKALDPEWYFPDDPAYIPDSQDEAIPQQESQIAFDLGLGAFYLTDDLYFGISSTHINEAKIKYEKSTPYLSRHYYIVSGYRFQMSNPLFEILPSIMIKSDGRTNQLDATALLRYNKRFWGGVSYRAGDALIGLIGLELFNGIQLGYSYDFSTSDIGNYSDGSHEIYIGYCFSLSVEKIPQKYRSIRFL